MRVVPGLAFRLLRGSGGGLLSAGLSAVATAICVALLLLTLGVNHGFSERAERESWLNPLENPSAVGKDATALQAVSTDYVHGDPIAVVDLAATNDTEDAPTLPGMDRFPGPGEVWMSPALTELARELPSDQLADRIRTLGTTSGVLGDDALTYPGQLVAVVGRDAGDPALSGARPEMVTTSRYSAAPTRVAGFSGTEPAWYAVYRALAAFATALVVVPLVVLGAAAGRLATAQRDRRLSAMRLFGATPGQVLAVTTFETVLVGTIGTLAGAALYVLCMPLAARVEASGGTWFVPDLWVGAGVFLATLVAAPLVVGASALLGMRRLVVSPLGVARRQSPRGARLWRLLLFVALIAGYAVIAPSVGRTDAVPFAVFLGVLFLALSVLGPFVVGLLGGAMTLLARGPETLLAGRRLVDDPRSAWRTVGGITLAGFVAGFLTVTTPQDVSALVGASDRVDVVVPASDSAALAGEARGALRGAGVDGPVSVSNADAFVARGTAVKAVSVVVSGGADERDEARTALSGVSPWQPPVSSEADSWEAASAIGDITSASLLVLAVMLAVASASAAITGVAGVLDRRKTYGLLRLAGTPLSVLDGARLRETLAPLVTLGGGAVVAGALCALPLMANADWDPDPQALTKLGALALLAVFGTALAELAGGLGLRLATRRAMARRE